MPEPATRQTASAASRPPRGWRRSRRSRAAGWSGCSPRHDPPLTVAQYLALQAVAGGGASGAELARRTGVSGPAVSQLLAALVDAGLVEREASAEDRRRQTLSLSADGRAASSTARGRCCAGVRDAARRHPAAGGRRARAPAPVRRGRAVGHRAAAPAAAAAAATRRGQATSPGPLTEPLRSGPHGHRIAAPRSPSAWPSRRSSGRCEAPTTFEETVERLGTAIRLGLLEAGTACRPSASSPSSSASAARRCATRSRR